MPINNHRAYGGLAAGQYLCCSAQRKKNRPKMQIRFAKLQTNWEGQHGSPASFQQKGSAKKTPGIVHKLHKLLSTIASIAEVAKRKTKKRIKVRKHQRYCILLFYARCTYISEGPTVHKPSTIKAAIPNWGDEDIKSFGHPYMRMG